jgi:hypothetical protein
MPGAHPRVAIGALGALQSLLFVQILQLSPHFYYGASERPILETVGCFVLATLAWFLTLLLILRRREDIPGMLPLVLLFAALNRLILLPSEPILEVDFYRYLWDGRVTSSGFNPYHFSPWQVRDAAPEDNPPPELIALARLARQSESVTTIFQRVHYPEVPTVYPPAAQLIFAVVARWTPADEPLLVHVLIMKAVLLGFDVATIGVLIVLFRHLGLPASWCVTYAWCPLVLKEFANSGHLDSIAVFFTTLAFVLLIRFRHFFGAYAGAASLGAAILAKSYPVILLPTVAGWLLGRFGRPGILPLLLVPAVVVAGYAPFLGGTPVSEGGHHPGTGLVAFLTQWESNDFLFMLVHDNVRVATESPGRHVLVSETWREALQRNVLAPGADGLELPLKARPAFVLTQLIMATILVILVARWAWQVYGEPTPETLLRKAFLTLAWAWLLSSAANPWYLIWCLPLMVFGGRCTWFLLPGVVWLYYGRFWVESLPWEGRPVGPDDVVWLEYLPFYLALSVETAWSKLRGA